MAKSGSCVVGNDCAAGRALDGDSALVLRATCVFADAVVGVECRNGKRELPLNDAAFETDQRSLKGGVGSDLTAREMSSGYHALSQSHQEVSGEGYDEGMSRHRNLESLSTRCLNFREVIGSPCFKYT